MVNLSTWLHTFLSALEETFPNRVWFVGLQGSYARGEATEASDIDIVVILDELSYDDIQSYDNMLNTLPHRNLLCGFISGKTELLHWEPSDLFQFYHDTISIKGSLDELLVQIDKTAVCKAIKSSACNIYHSCVHNMLYEKNETILKDLYKSASFVIQAIYFQQSGTYIRHQNELLCMVEPDEQQIIKTFLELKKGGEVAFQAMSNTLFTWSKTWINQI